ncbi:response regulator transcription factor [Eggerthella guodeyinii]|uniref:HTH luxR-type domain-containing protein n=1 Tax=Eggerthella guodeyinii TaxID=2690837 RepID=A0A6N7RLA9_9ACTN|nr:helix-turn-helix transcriptional regulator [Eggerthella guodeyinii]MRX81727.1 hypothetical protein [Eggerthella guodeyinii]
MNISGKLARGVCGVSFIAAVMPFFLTLASNSNSMFNNLEIDSFSTFALVGGTVGGFILFAASSGKAARLLMLPGIAVSGTFLSIAGYAIAFVCATSWSFATGGFCFGIGVILLCMPWFACLKLDDFRSVLAYGSFAVLCAALLDQVLFQLPAALNLGVLFALLVVGTIPPLLGTRLHGSKAVDAEHVAQTRSDNDFDDPFPSVGLSGTVFGLVIAGFAIYIAAQFGKRRFTAPFIYWIVFPFVAATLIVLDSFPLGSPAFMVGAAGITIFCSGLGMFAVAFLLIASKSNDLSPYRSISFSLAIFSLAGLMGTALGHSGLSSDERGSILLVLSTLYMVYLLFSPAIQLWTMRKGSDDPNEKPGDKLDLIDTCTRLSCLHGLSPREEEVLVYIGQGYNSPYIAKALFISDSTVRSHIKSIYRKMGITSRMELLDLVNEESSPAA